MLTAGSVAFAALEPKPEASRRAETASRASRCAAAEEAALDPASARRLRACMGFW